MTNTESFTVSVKVANDLVEGLLVSAFEGGISYWACIVDYKVPAGETKPEIAPYAFLPLREGGAVVLCDREEVPSRRGRIPSNVPRWSLDRQALQKGLDIMAKEYPNHFANVTRENYDANTGDVFVQCCLFGKLVYG